MDCSGFYRLLEKWSASPPPFRVIGMPHGRLRSEFNPHVHSGWEFKQTQEGELHLVPPGVPHETTGICPVSLETGKSSFTLLCMGRFLFCDREPGHRSNLLPELFALLVRVPGEETILRLHLLRSVFEAARILVREFEATPDVPGGVYTSTLNYMMRNYYRHDLSVEILAAAAGCSPQYLNRLFRKNSGLSLRKKLITIRLNKAHELLESGRYLVSDAARLTGWSSPFYFCTSFKRYFGVSPVSVRN